MATSLDLTKLLPPQYRDKTLNGLLRGLFNRHLSKSETVPLYGFVGRDLELQPGDIALQEQNLERQLNQLTPVLYTEHATERTLTTWPDVVQKLLLLGVDYTTLDEWFRAASYNYVPPIDLDKFCNFNQYVWIGAWVRDHPTEPYVELGIPTLSYVTPVMETSNPDYAPDYYVIGRGSLDSLTGDPLDVQPLAFTGWSDWSYGNLWVHRDDAIAFANNHGGVDFADLVQATRPIIEYSPLTRLNVYQTALGAPAESGTYTGPQDKLRVNQPPLFDIYTFDGAHLGKASSLFYYQEGSQYDVDQVLGRRVAVDENNDFTFETSLYNSTTKQLYFYKTYDGSDYSLKTIWRRGPEATLAYSKYDSAGTLLNQDKFLNYKNYYWTGVDTAAPLPSYNSTGLPEYVVVERGGSSDWSVFNFWTHVSQLRRSDLHGYVQATRPIIEFNLDLEDELLESKTELNQAPRFKHYLYDQATDSYEQLVSVTDPNVNDAYLDGRLFARLADLTDTGETVISSPEIFNLCVRDGDEYYLQGLYSGAWQPSKDGVIYGYSARISTYEGTGDGTLAGLDTQAVAVPEVYVVTWSAALNVFEVRGTVSGALGTAPIGVTSTFNGLTFTPTEGLVPFANGDTFTVELKSYVFEHQQVYVKTSSGYRTLSSPSAILTDAQSSVIVPATPELNDGAWEVPPLLEWNVQNETRAAVSQGDLYYHFISIIGAQDNLIGSPSGNNNWRLKASVDVGLGGAIKQYDGNTALLLGLLQQRDLSPTTLIEFARSSYEQLFVAIHEFVLSQVPQLLTDTSFVPPTSGDSISPVLVEAFKSYYASISPVTLNSASTVDDQLARTFFDTTSGIDNVVVTLPYLGLAERHPPQKRLDNELNINVIVHHDGHSSPLPAVSEETLKKVVTKSYVRSPGQSTPGLISGVNFPSHPYRGQFFFKTSTGQLYFYNVVSDSGELPDDAETGDYSYSRLDDELYEFDGVAWNNLGSSTAVLNQPWCEVKLDLIEANLVLAIEQELFDRCPPLSLRLDDASLRSNPRYEPLMQRELERFGAQYGSSDVYSSVYDATNAFTWNYSSIIAPGCVNPHATWQEIYREAYGTSRPDLEPWFSLGYTTEAAFLADAISGSYLPPSTTSFDPATMWDDVEVFVKTGLSGLGKPTQLSVDVSTGALLPPYSLETEGLTTTIPTSAGDSYEFGDLGPVELFWRRTTNYLYGEQKTFFKLDPLTYAHATWGVKYAEVGDEYLLNVDLQNKEAPSDFVLHGTELDELSQAAWTAVTVLSPPVADTVYTVKYVNRLDNVFQVDNLDVYPAPSFVTGIYVDAVLELVFTPGARGFYYGDTYVITVHPDSTFDVVFTPAETARFEGFNQVYVQYLRAFGEDLSLTVNKFLLTDWTVKLGYRFGGLINTDSLTVKVHDEDVVATARHVYLKENKYYDSSWLNALRVQLVQRGSTVRVDGVDVPAAAPGGPPGSDWIFRVDNYNPQRPLISWYTYDQSGPYQTFLALNGSKTSYAWKRYTDVTGTAAHDAPFLVIGIQNLVTFMFGYSDLREAEGWRFNDQNNPVLDASTGRPIGYQLLVEQFINQQFGGVVAGSAFLFNPFSRKVWFATEHGVVTNLFQPLGLEQETVVTLLDENRKRISNNQVRVFREDPITELVFDDDVFTLHLLLSEYEYVILFESYSAGDLLLYDPFLGQKTDSIFFNGERQPTFTGRLDLGGNFFLGQEMKRNLESSVEGVLKLYDTTANIVELPETSRARALLGFQKKDYFVDRGSSDQTEFRFWQGKVANKGTNFSVNAYLNSAKYQTANLDEYWAYRIAEYGDARGIEKPELKTEPNDCQTELTNYLFLEEDELDLLNQAQVNDGFDIAPYDTTGWDSASIYSSSQLENMEQFDPSGCIYVSPVDESRWFRYVDLRAFEYFTADVQAQVTTTFTSLDDCYVITDASGVTVNADVFEIVDPNYDGTGTERYYEVGEVVPSSDPLEYTAPKFKRLNRYSIQILDDELLNKPLTVIAYGPAFAKYSPVRLFNYKSNTTVLNDIIWWDPARGVNHPEARAEVDYRQARDPAKYNRDVLNYKNERLEKLKPWGANEVGKIWWNTDLLAWQPYSDTKVYENLSERLARWGGIADWSNINVYEWVRSDVPPESYEGDGEVAVDELLSRTRTWYQRVVAWRYSATPTLTPRVFSEYQPDDLKLLVDDDGVGYAVLATGSWSDLSLKEGSKLAAATYSSSADMVDANITGVFGTARVTSVAPTGVLGTQYGLANQVDFVDTQNVVATLSVNSQQLNVRNNPFGQYRLSTSMVDGDRRITLTHLLSGRSQTLSLPIAQSSGVIDVVPYEDFEPFLIGDLSVDDITYMGFLYLDDPDLGNFAFQGMIDGTDDEKAEVMSIARRGKSPDFSPDDAGNYESDNSAQAELIQTWGNLKRTALGQRVLTVKLPSNYFLAVPPVGDTSGLVDPLNNVAVAIACYFKYRSTTKAYSNGRLINYVRGDHSVTKLWTGATINASALGLSPRTELCRYATKKVENVLGGKTIFGSLIVSSSTPMTSAERASFVTLGASSMTDAEVAAYEIANATNANAVKAWLSFMSNLVRPSDAQLRALDQAIIDFYSAFVPASFESAYPDLKDAIDSINFFAHEPDPTTLPESYRLNISPVDVDGVVNPLDDPDLSLACYTYYRQQKSLARNKKDINLFRGSRAILRVNDDDGKQLLGIAARYQQIFEKVVDEYEADNPTIVFAFDDAIGYLIPGGSSTPDIAAHGQTTTVANMAPAAVMEFGDLGFTLTYHASNSISLPVIAAEIGNPAHDIWLRSAQEVSVMVPFVSGGVTYDTFPSSESTVGWIAWDDPVDSPDEGELPPFNKYEPVTSEFELVGDYLQSNSEEIAERVATRWTWFDGTDYTPYKYVWSNWNKLKPDLRQREYCESDGFFESFFDYSAEGLTDAELLERINVYVNGLKLPTDLWAITDGVVEITSTDLTVLRKGFDVTVVLSPETVTPEQLKFDPELSDPNPLVLTQYVRNLPHAFEERRTEQGSKTLKSYYFWVKNKESLGPDNKLTIKRIAALLLKHDGVYSVPQVLKYYNQVDGRPNRYGLLSVVNLGRYVRHQGSYKLRLTRDATLRNSDRDLDLKNLHHEWVLLRQYQPTRIPRQLWDLLTDALCGETQLGQELPIEPLREYDEHHGTSVRYGFSGQQILVDPSIAIDTVKYTILNTRVESFVDGELTPDYISYPGFDLNELDAYFTSPTSIRLFMTDLWRYAKPKQVNELFFAVLLDAAAKNLELTDFFKTSLVALSDVRTVST